MKLYTLHLKTLAQTPEPKVTPEAEILQNGDNIGVEGRRLRHVDGDQVQKVCPLVAEVGLIVVYLFRVSGFKSLE